jgi:hypothetical protein
MNSNFLRVLYGLLAGFAAMTVLVLVFTRLHARAIPNWAALRKRPTTAYVFVNVCAAFVSGVAGGYISAWIADEQLLGGVVALAIVALVMGGISTLEQRGKQPLWYQLLLAVIPSLGVVAGGLLRMKVLGISIAGFR